MFLKSLQINAHTISNSQYIIEYFTIGYKYCDGILPKGRRDSVIFCRDAMLLPSRCNGIEIAMQHSLHRDGKQKGLIFLQIPPQFYITIINMFFFTSNLSSTRR